MKRVVFFVNVILLTDDAAAFHKQVNESNVPAVTVNSGSTRSKT